MFGALSWIECFSTFHFQFSTFPFTIFLLSFSILTPFPFFPCLFYPGRSAENSRSEVSGGALCPPAHRLVLLGTPKLFLLCNTSCSTMDWDTQTYKQLYDFPKLVIIWGYRCLILSGLFLLLLSFDTDFIEKKTSGYVRRRLCPLLALSLIS